MMWQVKQSNCRIIDHNWPLFVSHSFRYGTISPPPFSSKAKDVFRKITYKKEADGKEIREFSLPILIPTISLKTCRIGSVRLSSYAEGRTAEKVSLLTSEAPKEENPHQCKNLPPCFQSMESNKNSMIYYIPKSPTDLSSQLGNSII